MSSRPMSVVVKIVRTHSMAQPIADDLEGRLIPVGADGRLFILFSPHEEASGLSFGHFLTQLEFNISVFLGEAHQTITTHTFEHSLRRGKIRGTNHTDH